MNLYFVIPAQAGIQGRLIQHRLLGKPSLDGRSSKLRFPAFAGMTTRIGLCA
ncbi:MAG: hypothetical protein LBE78_12730 [Burkholderiaceae bacterium]|jgi:hypothetical protein|nr:hypothetical protein [Burkholderiaceae bacterium]